MASLPPSSASPYAVRAPRGASVRSTRRAPALSPSLRAFTARHAVTAIGCAAFAGASLAVFGATPRAALAAFFASVLVVLARIDLRERILPNRIVLPATAIVLGAQIALEPARALEPVVAALVAAVVLLLPLVFYPAGMGMGDVKLGLLLGAGVGGSVLFAIALAFILVFPVALFVLVRRGRSARGTAIPFGPFLAAGALIVLFAGGAA